MTKYPSQNLIFFVILLGLFLNSCNGQVNTNSANNNTNTSKPIPEIIGTPPPRNFQAGSASEDSLVNQYIRTIFQDSKGNFWFGPAGESVVRYDVKTLRYFSKNEFFNGNKSVKEDYGNSVHAIAEDRNGNIWFGTYIGAIKYDGKTFRSYDEENGLNNIMVGRKSILIDKSGNMWVGTDGGVYQYDPSADTTGGKCFSFFDMLGPVIIKDIMEDKSGNIWFASQNNGVFRYDGKTIINIAEKEALGDNYAGGMIQDNIGNYWFCMKGGVCRYDGKNFTEITTKNGLGGSEISGIFMEKSGMIWITARGSTTRYDPSIDVANPEAFTVFTEEDGINCCVQSMYQDKEGNMWWGTGSGLYRFDGKRFYKVKQNGPW